MKYFALIFLFGLASASLLDLYPNRDDEDALLKPDQRKVKDRLQTELGRKLQEALNNILKKINETIHEGKDVKQELVDQAMDICHKLKTIGMDIGEEAKDLLNYYVTRLHRWAERILEIFDNNSTEYYSEPEVKTELAKKLLKEFKLVLKHIEQAVKEGKEIEQKWLDEAKDLARKLREAGVEVKNEFLDMIEFTKKRVKEWAREILDIIRGKKSTL